MSLRARVMLLILLLAAVVLACPIAPPCPIHDGATGYFVRYDFVDGVQLGVYRCSRQHNFLVRCN